MQVLGPAPAVCADWHLSPNCSSVYNLLKPFWKQAPRNPAAFCRKRHDRLMCPEHLCSLYLLGTQQAGAYLDRLPENELCLEERLE